VGGFSYSEGLEAAVEAGLVQDETTAAAWLVDQLHLGLARADLAVVCAAVEAARGGDAARIARLDAWVRQTRETSELRQQAEQMGRSLQEWRMSLDAGADPVGWAAEGPPAMRESAGVAARAQPMHPTHLTPTPTYPIAFALAAAATGASGRHIALTFALAWSENMVQAAIRSVPLGQSAGQRILARLAQGIPEAVDQADRLDDAHRQSFTPMLAILSAQHESQYSRLFRS
jgi:urease accessory protein